MALDLNASLWEMQGTEEQVRRHHRYAPGKSQTVGNRMGKMTFFWNKWQGNGLMGGLLQNKRAE